MLAFNVYLLCKESVDYQADINIICAFMSFVLAAFRQSGIRIVVVGDFNNDLLKVNENVKLSLFYERVSTT